LSILQVFKHLIALLRKRLLIFLILPKAAHILKLKPYWFEEILTAAAAKSQKVLPKAAVGYEVSKSY
jgi:hypothetical protein